MARRNRWWTEGYSWKGLLGTSLGLLGVGIVVLALGLLFGIGRWEFSGLFAGLAILWAVRALMLYRTEKRGASDEDEASGL
ncbi:hypothetical protein ACFJGV_04020 [Cnuibacter sp. UC19_7]|uniref:hypothetical protein n=1 Tax=Cnuibacter sp. UC19_7 TaxID=3350166 RepID=UPI00366EDE8E